MTAQATRETRADFHTRRAKGIGGSDVGAILGLSRYRTPEQVWLEKTGQVAPDDSDPTPDQQRGITFEPIALRLYSEKSGNAIIPGTQGVHPDYPWMLYTTDGYEIDKGDEVLLEVKCPSLGMFSRIKREGLPDDWNLQMQHYLCCSGYPRGRWVIFCADRMELLDFVVEADLLLHEMLIQKEREFWTLVETMSPPANVIAEVRGQEIVVVGTVTKRNDTAALSVFTQLREAKALAKNAEELEEQAKLAVLDLIENRPGIYEVPGVGRVNYQQRAGRLGFDSKALENAKPLDRIATAVLVAEVIKGYTNMDVAVESLEWLKEAELDLTQFIKTGKPFEEMRFTPDKAGK